MTKNLLIPDHIDSYYIFTKKIVGIDIGRNEIHATICSAHGNKRTIEKLIEQQIETDSNLSLEERTIRALKSLHSKLGSYDILSVAISSASVIFKELSLPFLGPKKIKMVVPFEVESLLPFTLDQAVIDSIITHEDTQNKRTNILVAAVKKDHINDLLKMFNAAEIPVDKITVDMFELYGLYKSIPAYNMQNQTVALVDLGLHITRIAVLIENQLKYIRVLPRGLISVSKKIAQSTNTDPNESFQLLLRFGAEKTDDSKYSEISQDALAELLQEIKFTINAYTTKLKSTEQLNLVVLTGLGADIPGISEISQNILQLDSQILQAKKVVYNGQITSKTTYLPNSFVVSIATALSLPVTEDFNLNEQYAAEKKDKLLNNQLIALATLSGLILFSFLSYSFLRIRKLKNTVRQAETEAITKLKSNFKIRDPKTLKEANRLATNELQKQESAWRQLSAENRYSLLNYLTELSKCINPKDIQLNLTGINIKEDTIRIYGEVPDYTQLAKLQNQLKCPLFKNVPKLQEPNFKADPIILTINKDQEI